MEGCIWRKDHYQFKLNTLTEEDVKNAEEIFKVKFPDAYLNILSVQNGGEIIYNAFRISEENGINECLIEVTYIYGIGKNPGILDSHYLLKEWGMPNGLILFNGDGHSWLAFDYRHVSSEPPIVCVNNDEETKIIKIANSFSEFLEKLFIVEYEIEGHEEYEMPIYTKEIFAHLLDKDDVEEIERAIIYFTNFEFDMDWLGNELLKLTDHPDKDIRNRIANSLWSSLTYKLDVETLDRFIEIFKNDPDVEIQQYAILISEKINYSLDDLKSDIDRCIALGSSNIVSFIFKENVYIIYLEGTLKLEGTNDIQIFYSAAELLNKAKLDGHHLKEIWSEVRIL